MIPAALLGFSLGTAIAWWVVLRSLSHGESEFGPATIFDAMGDLLVDPLDEVQPADLRVWSFTAANSPSVTRTFQLDCE